MKYKMSFSTGGLFIAESVEAAERFLMVRDWSLVRERAEKENWFQMRTGASLTRMAREMVARLATLSEDELELLVEGSSQDQGYLLWLAVCRYYAFVGEFAEEIVVGRYRSLRTELSLSDFDAFFHSKSIVSQDLEDIKDSTRKKLRQVLFRMMRESQILDDQGCIIPVMLSTKFCRTVQEGGDKGLEFFPSISH